VKNSVKIRVSGSFRLSFVHHSKSSSQSGTGCHLSGILSIGHVEEQASG